MNKIAIIGAKGNMGLKYKVILEHLNLKPLLFDIDDWGAIRGNTEIEGIIIASPTKEHYLNIDQFIGSGIPVLCEKPITKCPIELKKILDADLKLTMVNQYKYLIDEKSNGESYYDYYKTGNDGLEWDCINIIGLSNSKVNISNTSPVWRCMINGKKLSLSDMDEAYILMIKDWIKNPDGNKKYIEQAHKKVREGFYVKDINSDTSKVKQYETSRQVHDGHKRSDNAGLGYRILC